MSGDYTSDYTIEEHAECAGMCGTVACTAAKERTESNRAGKGTP